MIEYEQPFPGNPSIFDTLKVNNNNEITIKRCKESWSREEVIWHLFNATNELGNGSIKSTDVKTYIEQNL